MEQGCILPLCELLSVPDAKMINVALEGLENILRMVCPTRSVELHTNPFWPLRSGLRILLSVLPYVFAWQLSQQFLNPILRPSMWGVLGETKVFRALNFFAGLGIKVATGNAGVLKLFSCSSRFFSFLQGEDEKTKLNAPVNQFAQLVQEAGGLDKIESLQNHSNNEIYEHAVTILDQFFEVEVCIISLHCA